MYAGRSAAHWFAAASTSGGCFPSPSATDPTDRPPTLASRVHSLVPSVLFGVPSPTIRACPNLTRHSRIESRLAAAPAEDFVPHRDITGGVHDPVSGHGHAGLSRAPLRSVLGLSQPLDGFLRHRLRGLVSSRSHVQGSSPFRGFSRLAAGHGSSPPPASAPLGVAHSPASRLPCAPPSTSRRCSTNRCVCAKSAVKPPPRPLPSTGSLLSQGPARPPCSPGSRPRPSALDVFRRTLRPRLREFAGPAVSPSASCR